MLAKVVNKNLKNNKKPKTTNNNESTIASRFKGFLFCNSFLTFSSIVQIFFSNTNLVYMSEKLIISNVENYNKTFEFSGIKPYISRYVDIINEYMMYVVENMIIQDDTYLLFLIRRGVETIMHCFKILLMYTKNLELTIYQCKKALYYYIEFIGQISDVSLHHSYLQLNSKDATLFVYKTTIYDINNIYRKKFTLDDNEQELLNSISNIITLFNASLFHLLQKER